MNHLFRLLKLILLAPFKRIQKDMTQPAVLRMRVWPTDLDLLMHMNNGVYLSLMDLGRLDLMARAGAFFPVFRKGIYPVLTAEAIQFRKSLEPFQKFELHTRVTHWDDRYFFLEQKFMRKNEVYASAVVKGRFLRRGGGKVSPLELFEIVGWTPPLPAGKPTTTLLRDLESELRNV